MQPPTSQPPTSNVALEFLRRSLWANAAFSTVSGVGFLLASDWIGAFLDHVPGPWVAAVGAQLLIFAGGLAWLASRPSIPRAWARAVVTADLLWVVGTVLLVYADAFSRSGAACAVLLADAVLVLAILQTIGIERMGTATPDSPAPLISKIAVRSAAVAIFLLPIAHGMAESLVPLPLGPTRMLSIAGVAVALGVLAVPVFERAARVPLARSTALVTAIVIPLLAVAHLLSFSRFGDGPFGPVPGGPFAASAAEAPLEWSPSNSLLTLELEVDRERPRTLETVFLVHDESLYVAANMPEHKRWPRVVRDQRRVRVRLGKDEVYALEARFVESADRTHELTEAMNARYGFDLSLGGPIWFFALEPTPRS